MGSEEDSSKDTGIIKIVFESSNRSSYIPKIKKLLIDNDALISVGYIKDKLSINCSDFYYYDEDGDRISVSQDNELQHAYREKKRSDECLRLYTTEETNAMESEESQGRNVEDECTKCGHRTGKFRYKCVICVNVELCGRCEAFGEHSNHDLIRLCNDNSYPSQFYARLHRLYDKLGVSCTNVTTTPQVLKAEELELFEPKVTPLTTRQIENVDEAKVSYASEGYAGVLQIPVQTVLLKEEFQIHEAKESEEIAGSLRGLRKEIDKLLIDDEEENIVTKKAPTSFKPPLQKTDSVGTESTCPFDLIEVLSLEEATPKDQSPEEISTEKKISLNVKEPSFSPPPKTEIKSSYLSNSYEYSRYSRPQSLIADTCSYSVRSTPSPYVTSSRKITESLIQMKAMGFTDDDGWLTQLLTMKHGDIEKVLDVLTPVDK